MADPDQIEDFSQIKIERDYPIVTQPWVTPYKPAAKPLPATWKNLIATAAPSNTNPSTNSSKLLYDQDFFSNQQNQQRRGQQNNSNKNNLLGGAQFRPGNDGLNGTMSQKNALATTPKNSAHHNNNNASFGTGGFNAFASAARSADGGKGLFVTDENAEELLRNNNNSNNQKNASRFGGGGGGGGGIMLGSGLQRLSTMNDESDEYDERLDLMKHNLRTRDGAPPHHRRHPKTREEKEAIREDFRQKREEGYNSGGDLDEGCVGALGEDDEFRAERLKFTTGASHEDGTFKSPYHTAIEHYQKRGGESRSAMKTPNSAAKLKKQATANPLDYTSSSPAPGGSSTSAVTPKPQQQLFKPSGLRTPQFDPTANLPGPVARHQRRHHHHLLRLLHHPGKPESSHHNHNHDGSGDHFHLFPPHEIPTSQIDEERKKNPFNPDTWMLGDATVDDVMNRHFLKK